MLPAQYAESAVGPSERRISEVYTEYQRRLQDASAVDFDDLLVLAVRLFREHPEALQRYRSRFKHILVDEFQDTNVAQWELVRMLSEEHRSIMVVGDDAQSVYRFRGADFRNIRRFEDAFPDSTVVVLDQNYRSTGRILEAANAVIANNATTRKKHLWTDKGEGERLVRFQGDDEHDEAQFVCQEIHRLVDNGDHRYGDVAVFYRTNVQSRVLEEALVRSGVPYRVFGGVKFYDRREIKDALAYLKALVNPDDEVSWKRIANTPRRGVGDTSVNKIDAYAAGADVTFREAVSEAVAAGVTGKALGGLRDLLALMAEVEVAAEGGVGSTLEAVLTRSGYLAELEAERSVEAHGRIENLQELVGSAREFDEQVERGDIQGPRRDRGRRRRRGIGGSARRTRARAGVPRSDLARHRPRRERSRAEHRHADDAALREGSGVPRRVPHRSRRRRVPARAQPRRSRRARGRAPALLRRAHARRGTPVSVPRVEPDDVRRDRLPAAEPVPRRDPRRPRRARPVTTSRAGRGFGAHREAVVAAAVRRDAGPEGARGAEHLALKIGDDVVHEKFGEGVIVDINGHGDKAEARVQFRGVGEKTLLLSWAPLNRVPT